MAQLLADLAAGSPTRTAIADPWLSRDWATLDHRVNRWVHALRRSGLAAGDTIAIVSGNRVEVFEALLGCLHAGITVVPVNRQLTADEVGHLLADSGCRAVLADPAAVAAVARALDRSGLDCPVRLVLGAAGQPGFEPVEPALAAASDREPADQRCGSVMLYTSGTSGVPKGVVNNVFRSGQPLSTVDRLRAYAGYVLGVPAGCPALLVGPWYHSAQLYFALLPLLRGCSLLIRSRFEPAETLQLIDQARVGVCHLVPTQFVRLLRLPEPVRRGFRGDSLRRVWHGAGPCPPEIKRRMIEWWGPVFVEYYAATEGGVVTLIDSAEWLARPGSVGRAVPPTRVVVAGPDGTELPPGQVGRVFFRRSAAHDFHYHRDPDQTRAAHLAPGVYTYGELGYLDPDGYLFLTGRADHTIISGGINIYPAEVEAALLAHPAVQDAAVIGVADPEFGHRVLAVVQLVAGRLPAGAAPAELERHCRTRLAGFKVPRVWRLVDRLPRDEAGKLRRVALPGG
jgi:long-chain acyl-CoA synthetase